MATSCAGVSALPAARPVSRSRASPRRVAAACKARKDGAGSKVEYGSGWFAATDRRSAQTVADQIGRRIQEDKRRGVRDRADLYTDKWDGSEYKGSPFNFATFLGLLFILTPVLGLVFAYATYGVVWG